MRFALTDIIMADLLILLMHVIHSSVPQKRGPGSIYRI
jgi:hypothetical protein